MANMHYSPSIADDPLGADTADQVRPLTASRRTAYGLAACLYLVWVLATWLLEGRIETLLRPDAILARLRYALVANLLIGTAATVWIVRILVHAHIVTPRQAGFRGLGYTLTSILAGGACGFLLYAVQRPPTFDPMVITNAYAQVLVVSVAEVLVCWAVVGSVAETLLQGRSRGVTLVVVAFIASALFGVYHVAHSPPFNTVGMVLLLTAIGLLTSLFFFVSRDVYGTIVFHNFAGIFGVIQVLEASKDLATYKRPMIPVLIMAVVSTIVLIATHVFWLRTPSERRT